jgi:hypothetical protein
MQAGTVLALDLLVFAYEQWQYMSSTGGGSGLTL